VRCVEARPSFSFAPFELRDHLTVTLFSSFSSSGVDLSRCWGIDTQRPTQCGHPTLFGKLGHPFFLCVGCDKTGRVVDSGVRVRKGTSRLGRHEYVDRTDNYFS